MNPTTLCHRFRSRVLFPASPWLFAMGLAAFGLFCLLAGPVHAAPTVPPSDSGETPEPAAAPPAGLSDSAWRGIRAAHEDWRRRFEVLGDGTRSALHPGQQWSATFDGRGFLITPDEGDWTWGLELKAFGAARDLSARHELSRPEAVASEENRLVRRWGRGLTEWYLNRAEGLQQGWTIEAPPAGAEAEDGLRLDFALRGGLVPTVSADGRAVSFARADGNSALSYGGLKAWDAGGRELPVRFERGGEDSAAPLAVVADTRGARFPVTIDPLVQQAYLKASNTDAGDRFGWSVSVSGDTVVVGATGEASSATGVNGDESDNSASQSGAAYVFTLSGTAWSQQAYLKASNTGTGDFFGQSVSVSGDTVVVGSPFEDSNATGVNGDGNDSSADNSGAAYVFIRSGTAWSQQAYLKASNTGAGDRFGESVSVSGDTVVVGALFEASSATGVNGDGNDDSALESGAAYVFTRSGTAWSQQAYLKASNTGAGDGFGASVSVSGDTVVVGASGEASNATGVNGNGNDDSASESGAAYVFTRSGTAWSQQAYLKASNTGAGDRFGTSVSVSGDTVVVGAPREDSNATGVNGNGNDSSADNSGAAYVFIRSGTAWSQQAYLKASNTGANDLFGLSVSVSGDTVVVGALLEDSNATGVNGNENDDSADNSGAAYVFIRSGTDWSQQAYLKASNTGENAFFGQSVSVSGDTVVVGAPQEAGNATGVNGNGNDNSAPSSGAAYVFFEPDTTRPTLKILAEKKLKTPRPRHTVKGQASDNVAVAKVEVRSRLKKGWRKVKLGANGRFKFRTPKLKSGKNVVEFRAIDTSGNRSKVKKVRPVGTIKGTDNLSFTPGRPSLLRSAAKGQE